MKKWSLLVALALILGFAASPAMAWEPTKDIEFVVPSSPGGGSDLNARTISDFASSEKLCPTTIKVINKPGGSGAVSFSYVASKKGDNHTLMVLHNGQDLGSYVLDWDVKAKDLTYLGTVAFDAQMLCAVAGSKFTDFKAALELSKQGRVTYGGSHKGNTDHLSYIVNNMQTGAKFNYVMFNSSGEVLAAMLGGHVDLGVLNPSECIGQVRAGKIIPLATYSSKREGGDLAHVPTFKELGYPDLVITDARAIAGPPDMSPDAVAFYENLFKKITELPKWHSNYIEKNFLTPVFLNAEESRKYFLNEAEQAMDRFKLEEGMVK